MDSSTQYKTAPRHAYTQSLAEHAYGLWLSKWHCVDLPSEQIWTARTTQKGA